MWKRIGMGSLALALVATAGCRVQKNESANGDDVKIATPFGGMSVKTDSAVVQSKVGISAYPGATPVHKDDQDNGAANVNMSFGNFHLGVNALSYQTPDAPDKVIAFYRKDLARYGAVILCHEGKAVGTPATTQDGLSCKGQDNNSTDVDGDVGTLKAGSKLHQHLVAIDRDGSGTKVGLVALDLPGHLGTDDRD